MKMLIGGLVCFWAVANGAFAQDMRERCGTYAEEAAKQEAQNRTQACGFEGPRWSIAASSHLAWCQTFPQLAVSEQRERAKLLQRCTQGAREGARKAACDHYAAIAEAQAASNAKAACEFLGPRWSVGRDIHFNWCMTQRAGPLHEEMTARERGLALCFAYINDYSDYGGDCDGVARRSVQQNETNNAQRCGLQGRDWISDYQTYKRYCEESLPGVRLDGLRNRQRQLQACPGN
ncbi:MAG: hypothetical protein SGJ17_05115 [Hyphomicrobiales bacterium]|nr:hypothetical protein [Hyphomicrobiales bacterium]